MTRDNPFTLVHSRGQSWCRTGRCVACQAASIAVIVIVVVTIIVVVSIALAFWKCAVVGFVLVRNDDQDDWYDHSGCDDEQENDQKRYECPQGHSTAPAASIALLVAHR